VITAFHCLLLLGLFIALGSLLANLYCFRGLEAAEPQPNGPLVSILIPARNEARQIARCAGSALAQDWPNLEVIVLDDGSTDGTDEILQAISDPRLRVISGTPLPDGWVGKNWACHQLSQAARGEWLLFIDADTEHAPRAVSAVYAHALRERADLVSSWPRLVTGTLGEKLIVPMVLFIGMVFYPHALVTALQKNPARVAEWPHRWLRALGAANGQMLFFRRTAYDRIGGHAALRDHLVEDVAFGRAVAERMGEGMRLINCEALKFSSCRMYHSLAETWSGFTKNARAVFEDQHGAFLALGIGLFVLFVVPFLSLLIPGAPYRLIAGEIGLIYTLRIILALRFRTSWVGALLHPVGVLLAIAIGFNSGLRSSRGGVVWKGRKYTLQSPSAGAPS